MTKGILTVLLLLISNIFMTFAWYGHLKFQEWGWMKKSVLWRLFSSVGDLPCLSTSFKSQPIELVLEKMEVLLHYFS